MLQIQKTSANRVEIDFSGKLDAIDMLTGLDELIAVSENISNGRMLYKISEISIPTLGALGVELSRLPQLFSLLGKFDKCAVLSDSAWLRTAANIEGALFPGIDIKSFEFDEVDNANAWLEAV